MSWMFSSGRCLTGYLFAWGQNGCGNCELQAAMLCKAIVNLQTYLEMAYCVLTRLMFPVAILASPSGCASCPSCMGRHKVLWRNLSSDQVVFVHGHVARARRMQQLGKPAASNHYGDVLQRHALYFWHRVQVAPGARWCGVHLADLLW